MFSSQLYALRLFIDKISIRERVLVLITLFAAILLIAQGILLITGLDSHDDVLKRITQRKSESSQLHNTLAELKVAVNNPRIIALENANKNLQQRINVFQDRVAEIDAKLMSPEQMPALLEELLDQQNRLTLVSFQVMSIVTIESNLDGRSLFYQHSLSMELEGEFESLSEYLAQIEDLPTQLFWDDLTIHTDDFPTLRIQLKVHTLSQHEEWLNV